MSKNQLQIKMIGMLVSMSEWYNFAIYSSLVSAIGEVVFYSQDPSLSLLYSFLLFSLSYIVRPLGAMLFGFITDKYNPYTTIKYSLILMILASIMMLYIPSIAHLTTLSIISLVIIRTLHGLAIGGTYGVSYVYVIENASKNFKNRAAANVCIGFMLGFLFGSISITLLSYFFQDNLSDAALKIAFLSGGLMAFLTLIYSSYHKNLLQQKNPKSEKIAEKEKLLKRILIVIGIGIEMVAFYSIFTFNTNFLITQKYSYTYINILNITNIISVAFFIFLFAYISDKTNKKYSLYFCFISFIFSCLLFPWDNIYKVLLSGISLGACYGSLPVWVVSKFKSNTNYYTAVTFNLSSSLFAGTIPSLLAYLSSFSIYSIQVTLISITLALFGVIFTASHKYSD